MSSENLAVSTPRWTHMVNDDALLATLEGARQDDVITVKLTTPSNIAELPGGTRASLSEAQLNELVATYQLELLQNPIAPEDKSSVIVSGTVSDILDVLEKTSLSASSVPDFIYADLPDFPKPERLILKDGSDTNEHNVISGRPPQSSAQAKREDLWQEEDFLDLEPELTDENLEAIPGVGASGHRTDLRYHPGLVENREDDTTLIPLDEIAPQERKPFNLALGDDGVPDDSGAEKAVIDDAVFNRKVQGEVLKRLLLIAARSPYPEDDQMRTVEVVPDDNKPATRSKVIYGLKFYGLEVVVDEEDNTITVGGKGSKIVKALHALPITVKPARRAKDRVDLGSDLEFALGDDAAANGPDSEVIVMDEPKIDRSRFDPQAILDELVAEKPKSIHARTLQNLFNAGKDGMEGLENITVLLEKRIPGGDYWNKRNPIRFDSDDITDFREKDPHVLNDQERSAYLKAVKDVTGTHTLSKGRLGYIGSLAGAGLLLLTGAGYYGNEATQRSAAHIANQNTPGAKAWQALQAHRTDAKNAADQVANSATHDAEFDAKEAKAREEFAKLKELLKNHDEAGLNKAAEEYIQRRDTIGSSHEAAIVSLGLGAVAILSLLYAGIKALEPSEELREKAKKKLKDLCDALDDRLEAQLTVSKPPSPGI